MKKITLVSFVLCLSAVPLTISVLASNSDKNNTGSLLVDTTKQVEVKAKEKPMEDKSAEKESASRGKMLYSNHCHACHESGVHIRAHRKVKKKTDIAYWVNRWSTYLKLNWKNEEKQQVVEFLDQTFYKFGN